MISSLRKKNSIKNVLKWLSSGFSFFFIAMLFFMVIHDVMTGVSHTDMIKDMVNYGFNKSNTNFMKTEEVAKKIYDIIINKKNYYNGQSIEFYNK
jgi:hypothetical protein